jgi:molybdopterin synthase sulfur carrier subunit
MKVTIKLFAIYRDILGQPELTLDVSDGTTVNDLFGQMLHDKAEAVLRESTMFAVNESYVSAETVLNDGDRVAFIPPVSGG